MLMHQQMNARLWRQGQEETVVIHHLIAKGTLDERVMAALERKVHILVFAESIIIPVIIHALRHLAVIDCRFPRPVGYPAGLHPLVQRHTG